MLDKLRHAASSWVALILIIPLVIAFAVWGIGDIFRSVTNTDVARVGDLAITATDYKREFDNTVQRLSRQTNGAIDSLQARSMGFDRQVLAGMVQRMALLVKAQEMDLAVSDEALRTRLHAMEVFHGGFGKFSPQTYREILAMNNMTDALFEASLREDIVREQLTSSITVGVVPPQKMAEALFAFQAERRKIAYLVIPPEAAGDIDGPDDETLQSYFEVNAPRYTAPEFRSLSFIWIEPQDLISKVVVDEQEVDDRYNFDPNRFATPELRTVQVIPFLTEVDVKAAVNKLKNGFTFEGLAKEKGLGLDGITQKDVAELTMADGLIAKAAFALEQDTISEPINGQLGWALVRVTSVTPGEAQSSEDAKKTIHDELALELAKDLLFELLSDLDDELAGGATLDEMATRLELDLGKIANVDRTGKFADGARPAAMPSTPEFLGAAFNIEQGIESDLMDTETGGAMVLRVDSIKEPAIKPLDSIRADVVVDYVNSKRAEALDALAASLAGKANSGVPFEDLAAAMDRAILSPEVEIARGYSSEVVSQLMSTALFRSQVGEYVSGPTGFGQSYVVAVTKSILPADLATSQAQISQVSEQLRQSFQADFADQYIAALQASLNVEVYQQVIDATLGALPNLE